MCLPGLDFFKKYYLAHFAYFAVSITPSLLENVMAVFQKLNNVFFYSDDVKQLVAGQVYNCLDVSYGIGLRVNLGPCIFYFSYLLRFGVVENVWIMC